MFSFSFMELGRRTQQSTLWVQLWTTNNNVEVAFYSISVQLYINTHSKLTSQKISTLDNLKAKIFVASWNFIERIVVQRKKTVTVLKLAPTEAASQVVFIAQLSPSLCLLKSESTSSTSELSTYSVFLGFYLISNMLLSKLSHF